MLGWLFRSCRFEGEGYERSTAAAERAGGFGTSTARARWSGWPHLGLSDRATGRNKARQAGLAIAQTGQHKSRYAREVAARRWWEAWREEQSPAVGRRATALAADEAGEVKRPLGAPVGWAAPCWWIWSCGRPVTLKPVSLRRETDRRSGERKTESRSQSWSIRSGRVGERRGERPLRQGRSAKRSGGLRVSFLADSDSGREPA